MIIIGFILWLIDKIKDRPKPVSAPCRERSEYGYHISDKMWERCKGVNPTGKFNDVC